MKKILSINAIILSIAFSVQAQHSVPQNQIRFSEARGFDYDPSSDAVFYNDYNNGQVVKLGDVGGNGWFLGKLGVGNSSPYFNLDVSGNFGVAGNRFNVAQGIVNQHSTIENWGSASDQGGISINFDGRSTPTGISQGLFRDLAIYNGKGSILGFFDGANGRLGIGTSSPTESLDVHGAINIYRGSNGMTSFITSDHDPKIWSSGNSSSLNYPFSNSDLGHLILQPRTSQLRDILFITGDGDDIRLAIKGNGNIGIGITNPDSKLVVDGKIRSEEVKVEIINGPDYVFESDYELRTLQETKEYISENRHLPEIPSAKEMEADGVELGDMNMRLLKKIEELTLHLIEQSERVEKLEKEVSTLKNK